jgi:HD-GYP domain-containing protein (c-di-GMP phosphodiesterase class II)
MTAAMLRVAMPQARPGMVLALPVHHPRRPATVLLRAGATLDEPAITRLRDLKYPELWIRYPGLDFLADFISPGVQSACAELAEALGPAFDSASGQAGARLDFAAYRRAVSALLERLASDPAAAVLVQETAQAGAPAIRHATNVCLLSLLMGMRLDFYLLRERGRLSGWSAKDLTGLGLAGLLHDAGMTRLAPDALRRWNTTFNESDPAWREHVQLGHAMVHDRVEPAVAAAVLQHHESFDGSGFPGRPGAGKGLRGSEAHVWARIVAAADRLDRLRHPDHAPGARSAGCPAREPRPMVRALKGLLAPEVRRTIDPMVLRALLSVAPPYPPGSTLRLSTGEWAVVTSWTPEDPCRPTLEVLPRPRAGSPDTLEAALHADGRRRTVDLRLAPMICVAEIDGVDVTNDNFAPAAPGEFTLTDAAREMYVRAAA